VKYDKPVPVEFVAQVDRYPPGLYSDSDSAPIISGVWSRWKELRLGISLFQCLEII